jgi:hypothetical protein
MNIHDVVESRDIFFSNIGKNIFFFLEKKTHSLALNPTPQVICSVP